MDLYNGEIVSYNLTERPLASMVKSMLLDAVEQLNKDDKPLLHSDQGWQYQMPRWQRWLGNDSNLLIVFYVQIMPDDLVMQLHRF